MCTCLPILTIEREKNIIKRGRNEEETLKKTYFGTGAFIQ